MTSCKAVIVVWVASLSFAAGCAESGAAPDDPEVVLAPAPAPVITPLAPEGACADPATGCAQSGVIAPTTIAAPSALPVHYPFWVLHNLIPSVRAAGGAYAPTVVGGDLNLKYRGSPNAQSCLPGGYYRKGDGDVQHIMATSDLAFSSSRSIGMSHTDHDAWFVAMTAP